MNDETEQEPTTVLKHWKAIAIGVACLVLMGVGYGIASWRHSGQIAGYDKREAARMAEIATKDAEQNNLRGQNDGLRQQNAQLSAKQEATEAIIKEKGGSIAAELKKIEQIDAQAAKDEAIIKAPADKCLRCKRFSEAALAQKLIDRSLSCKDECPQ